MDTEMKAFRYIFIHHESERGIIKHINHMEVVGTLEPYQWINKGVLKYVMLFSGGIWEDIQNWICTDCMKLCESYIALQLICEKLHVCKSSLVLKKLRKRIMLS